MEYKIIIAILSYFIGSIPTGLMLGKITGIGDIRQTGSGNIGATNMLRAGGKKLGALTLLIDIAKGFLAVTLAKIINPEMIYIAFLLVIIGHIFPIWLKFNGGKGVATFLGALFGFNIYAALIFIALWLTSFYFFRISALSALLATITMPFIAYFFSGFTACIYISLISVLIIYRHKGNILRMIAGEELLFTRK